MLPVWLRPLTNLKFIFLDKGPNSIINRFQMYDNSRHLLEALLNYYLVYGLEKVCTGDTPVQRYCNSVFKECRNVDRVAAITTGLTVSSGVGQASLATGLSPSTSQPPFL
jgi:hypothetical protein